MTADSDRGQSRILILGGGFGGVYTAIALEKKLRRHRDVEIALINKQNYFVFQPMLAEVISGSLSIYDPVVPIRSLCPRVNLYVGEVPPDGIDLERKTVTVTSAERSEPHTVAYDQIVLALGTLENFQAVPGLAEHGVHFKVLMDGLALRNRLIHALEAADVEQDATVRRAMLTFVMAGGGFSGVEAIAEVNDYVRDVARHYHNIKQEDIKIVLLHAGPRILPELPEKLSRYAQRLLDKRHVEIRLQTRLGAVTAEEAILSDGTKIPTRTLMATIGATPNPALTSLPCEQDRGRVVVNEFLEVPGYPGVWALGDCARVIDHKSGERCPPTAQYATREAKCLANNIVAEMNGKPKKPFSFSALGMMGSLGKRSAVGDVMGFKVSGLLAWLMWRAIYWAKLPGFNRKFRVALNWALHPFLGEDTVPIDPGTSEEIAYEHFEPGETVFKQGQQGDRLFVIVEGEVEVVREDGDGQEQVIAVLSKGDCFGEMALISGAPRGATARTKTRMDALTLRRSSFKSLFENLPQLRESFEQLVAQRSGQQPGQG